MMRESLCGKAVGGNALMHQFPYWPTGSQIVYREVWRGKVWTARPVTVVQDAPDLIALFLCPALAGKCLLVAETRFKICWQ